MAFEQDLVHMTPAQLDAERRARAKRKQLEDMKKGMEAEVGVESAGSSPSEKGEVIFDGAANERYKEALAREAKIGERIAEQRRKIEEDWQARGSEARRILAESGAVVGGEIQGSAPTLNRPL